MVHTSHSAWGLSRRLRTLSVSWLAEVDSYSPSSLCCHLFTSTPFGIVRTGHTVDICTFCVRVSYFWGSESEHGEYRRGHAGRHDHLRELPVVQEIHDWVPVWTAHLLRIQEVLWPKESVGDIRCLRQVHVCSVWHEQCKLVQFVTFDTPLGIWQDAFIPKWPLVTFVVFGYTALVGHSSWAPEAELYGKLVLFNLESMQRCE